MARVLISAHAPLQTAAKRVGSSRTGANTFHRPSCNSTLAIAGKEHLSDRIDRTHRSVTVVTQRPSGGDSPRSFGGGSVGATATTVAGAMHLERNHQCFHCISCTPCPAAEAASGWAEAPGCASHRRCARWRRRWRRGRNEASDRHRCHAPLKKSSMFSLHFLHTASAG
jgi:hypothetical protein